MDAVVDPADVGPVDPVEVFDAGVHGVANVGDTGIVDQDVDAGRFFECANHGGIDGIRVGHVAGLDSGQSTGGVAFPKRFARVVFAEFENDHLSVLLGEFQGNGASDTRTGSSDDGCFSL